MSKNSLSNCRSHQEIHYHSGVHTSGGSKERRSRRSPPTDQNFPNFIQFFLENLANLYVGTSCWRVGEESCIHPCIHNYYYPQTKFAKVMFLHVSVFLPTGGGCAWWGGGICMALGVMCGGGHAWQEGVQGRGCVWQGACMTGGMHGRGYAWQGVCIAGGMHGGGCAWQGACMDGGGRGVHAW